MVTVPEPAMPDSAEPATAEPRISVSVQAEPADLESWLALARRLEAAGFDALLMGDHPGNGASPWPALGCAAAVTRSLRLGTYVVQAGVREPMHVAADAATLNLLAPGRVVLGIGAGHTPREWTDIGRERPSPPERAGRLAEFAEAVAGLLAGRSVTLDGQYLAVRDARLDGVLAGPALAGTALSGTAPVRLVIGGGHPRLLRAAARLADAVGLAGLGRTLPDGHQHEVRWSAADLRGQLDLIRAEASRAGRGAPGLEALVQVVRVTDDRDAALAEVGVEIPSASAEDLDRTPFLLIGSSEQLAAQLRRQARELGMTSYVVREPAVPDLQRVLALLRD
jgi:probable F420-dependent oxidoreductase